MGEDKEYDRCKIFDIDYNSIESRPDENTQTIECNTWEYSNEYFDVSAF